MAREIPGFFKATIPLKNPNIKNASSFDKLVRKLEAQGGVDDPEALAASIERKKFGKLKFQAASARGRRRAARRRRKGSPLASAVRRS